MNYKDFKNYLAVRFGQEDDFFDGYIETVLPIGNNGDNRIVVFYPGDMLSLSVFFGNYPDKSYETIMAFIDDYNERGDGKYELRFLDSQIWVEVNVGDVNDEIAIQVIEEIIEFFAEDGEFAKRVETALANA